MQDAHHIIIGSGINALVAAALLGRKGKKVLVLERNDRIGGCLRTEEITAPGYVHDVMATTMVLFLTSPAFAALGKDLEARGLEFCHSPTPTGVLTPDGRHAVLSMDRTKNIAHFDSLASGDGQAFAQEMGRFGANAGFVFALLGGRLWSSATLKLVSRELWRRGPRALAAFFGEALAPARNYLDATYASEEMKALFAPWALHCGLGPESAYSAEMVKVIGFAIEAAGCPIVKGGAERLTEAFARLIRDQGGEIITGAEVARILPGGAGGRPFGVALTDNRRFPCREGVIASVTPHQLYEQLLRDWPVASPPAVQEGLKRYRYGKGNMQIHYALKGKPRWKAGEALSGVALLHLTPGLDGVSRSANEAERGLLPAEPTVCVGQPTALDPSRAPEGGAILWLQLPDTPRIIKGDAAGHLATPEDGRWTDALRERFADRVEAMLRAQIENFDEILLARRAFSPADLQAMNVNLVGGDPYGGFCGLDQFFLWRPFKTTTNYFTHVPGLHQIGASTHPGPGLAGGSGFLLASSLR
ncbi:FAD-dependent oxidoreductase [Xaviernesmea oryzae]|uniref:Pyridine nucleotide-disulfide oxidoreductase domain-containing protein 2 n=1 Tax=Xaviernesmea oryzae TaxID=464029 RepID=A0A1Q9B195_9HYPH|nr:NAD(P)/FAD-dependent oxidoreductase [Xaviernesmea oryzae]OLP61777.1 FAD-dependent oxidoreductase [Xaviernesmea oryzae]SEL77647.1 Phytoene dehydrogenase-related protein [Xaviernesmea oryzae]